MADLRSQLAEIAGELVAQPENAQGEIPNVQEPEANESEELPDEPIAPDESPVEIRDLKGLVEAIDVDPDFLYGLEVPMGDNEPPVKLGELKDALTQAKRQARDLETKLAQSTEYARLFQQLGDGMGQWSDAMKQAYGIMTAIETQFASTNWNDPDADRGELAYQKQQMVDAYAQARSNYEAAKGQHQALMGQAMEQYRGAELTKLLQAIPEWSDREKAKVETQSMVNLAKTYGFSPEDLAGVYDHRVIKLLRDFAVLKGTEVAAKQAVNKVSKAPKVLGTRGRKVQSSEQIDALIQQARNAPAKSRQQAELAAAKAILLKG